MSKVDFEVGTLYRPQNRFVTVTNENSVGTFSRCVRNCISCRYISANVYGPPDRFVTVTNRTDPDSICNCYKSYGPQIRFVTVTNRTDAQIDL